MSVLSAERIEVRRRVIGSSEVAALFGLDPRRTLFELWHQKAGNIPEPEDERAFWEAVLEPAVAHGIARLQGWKVRKVQHHVEHPRVPGMGATLGFEIVGHPDGPAPLAIESVDRLAAGDWPEGLPPLRFELEVQHQLACLPDRQWAALGFLVGGDTPRVFEYRRHPGAIARIERTVARFWRSIAENRPPEPDFERDLAALEALYGAPRPGSVRLLYDDERLAALCEEYERARRDGAEADRRRRAAKAALLSIVRDAETVFCDGFKILAPARSGGEVSYHRKPFRDFRVFPRSGWRPHGAAAGPDHGADRGSGNGAGHGSGNGTEPESEPAAARSRLDLFAEADDDPFAAPPREAGEPRERADLPATAEDDGDLPLPIPAHHLRILQAVVERDMPIDALADIVGKPLEEVSEPHAREILAAIYAWRPAPEAGKKA